jgi:hypothetical protein
VSPAHLVAYGRPQPYPPRPALVRDKSPLIEVNAHRTARVSICLSP